MADPIPASQGTGALASVTGFFKDLVNQATPVVSSYLDYRASRENAKTSVLPSSGMNSSVGAGSAQTSRDLSAVPITAQPWFPFAIGGVVLAVLGFGALLVFGRRK